mgnify:CR=1 FL=1
MILDDLRKIIYRNELVTLWYCDDIFYRGEFSAIPTVILHYPVSLIKSVNSMLYIYLE